MEFEQSMIRVGWVLFLAMNLEVIAVDANLARSTLKVADLLPLSLPSIYRHFFCSVDMEERYSNLADEAAGKTAKLRKLVGLLAAANAEQADANSEYQREIEGLLNSVSFFCLQLRKKTVLKIFYVGSNAAKRVVIEFAVHREFHSARRFGIDRAVRLVERTAWRLAAEVYRLYRE